MDYSQNQMNVSPAFSRPSWLFSTRGDLNSRIVEDFEPKLETIIEDFEPKLETETLIESPSLFYVGSRCAKPEPIFRNKKKFT